MLQINGKKKITCLEVIIAFLHAEIFIMLDRFDDYRWAIQKLYFLRTIVTNLDTIWLLWVYVLRAYLFNPQYSMET